MSAKLITTFTTRISLVTVLFLSLANAGGFAQMHTVNALPAVPAATENMQLPKGVEVIARVALDGQPVIRMYTQWEYGRTYLYIEHSRQSLTAVDVTQKRNPQIVNHTPEKITPVRYEELAEGGTIQVSPLWNVNPGIDNVGGRGMRSILEYSDPEDTKLLQAFGPAYNDLPDRDRRLVYFASASQLLIVQDNRLTLINYTYN